MGTPVNCTHNRGGWSFNHCPGVLLKLETLLVVLPDIFKKSQKTRQSKRNSWVTGLHTHIKDVKLARGIGGAGGREAGEKQQNNSLRRTVITCWPWSVSGLLVQRPSLLLIFRVAIIVWFSRALDRRSLQTGPISRPGSIFGDATRSPRSFYPWSFIVFFSHFKKSFFFPLSTCWLPGGLKEQMSSVKRSERGYVWSDD